MKLAGEGKLLGPKTKISANNTLDSQSAENSKLVTGKTDRSKRRKLENGNIAGSHVPSSKEQPAREQKTRRPSDKTPDDYWNRVWTDEDGRKQIDKYWQFGTNTDELLVQLELDAERDTVGYALEEDDKNFKDKMALQKGLTKMALKTGDTKTAREESSQMKIAINSFGRSKVRSIKPDPDSNDSGGFHVGDMLATAPYLKPYQLLGAAVMISKECIPDGPRGGILADTMGLGKTVTAIGCIAGHPAPKKTKPCLTLIVVPANATDQWRRHISEYLTEDVCVYRPSRENPMTPNIIHKRFKVV
jgi:SNF2 family DNA or RNA helicase